MSDDEPNMDPNQLWALGKIASVLDVSKQTAQRLGEKGEFGEVYMIGKSPRYRRQGVLDYINRQQGAKDSKPIRERKPSELKGDPSGDDEEPLAAK